MTEDLLKNKQFIRLSALVSALITNLRLKGLVSQEEILMYAQMISEEKLNE